MFSRDFVLRYMLFKIFCSEISRKCYKALCKTPAYVAVLVSNVLVIARRDVKHISDKFQAAFM